MNLAHIIEQLQEAHARLGNHPNVRLVIRGYAFGCPDADEDDHPAGYRNDFAVQESDSYIDFAKQTVYLPVPSLDHTP